MAYKVFISSNMVEFKEEREAIVSTIENDDFLNDFFKVFVFENIPSSGQSPNDTWRKNVLDSDIYIGLIGSEYGTILDTGLSPTETEYDLFNEKSNEVFIFIKDSVKRDGKIEKFIAKISDNHIYKPFGTIEVLIKEIKKSLTHFLHNQIVENDFDKRIIDYSSSKDIDMDSYNLFFKSVNNNSLKQLKEEKTPEEMLTIINAGSMKNNIFHFNNAGALFFAKNINKFNISHEIKMAKFKNGTRADIIDRKNSYNTLIDLMEDVRLFFSRNTKTSSVVVGMDRIDLNEYPFEVVREAIVNAVAHRDYKINSSPITFYIYDNRIEITSPGKLIPPLTIATLESANPLHRNKIICDIFSKTGYMEHYGTGISRMKKTMLEEGLKEPKFEEMGEFFKVTLWARDENTIDPELYKNNRNPLDKLGLNERQIKAFALMVNENKTFTINNYLNCFEISRVTASKDLNKLESLNLINKVKKGRSYIYYVK